MNPRGVVSVALGSEIVAVKELADRDARTISSWIRQAVKMRLATEGVASDHTDAVPCAIGPDEELRRWAVKQASDTFIGSGRGLLEEAQAILDFVLAAKE